MRHRILIVAALLFASLQMVQAQCKITNTFFQNGEELIYDMYFKIGFTSAKAGKLSLSVSEGSHKGKGAHKMVFQSNTSGLANGIYAVHDTLTSYMTKDLVPMAYVKNAMEGGDFTQEELLYNYAQGGKVKIQAKRHKNGEFRFDQNVDAEGCIYDLVSIIYYARTLDFSKMKAGDVATINFISGQKLSSAEIEYVGTKRVKANNGTKYDTLELSLNFSTSQDDKGKEAMRVFITNDKNRIPIEINSKLKKMGASVRGVLKSYTGLKNAY